MRQKIARIRVSPNYGLWIKFKNGETRIFDMRPYLNKGIFKELRNESFFKKVRIVWGGIQWPHQQDLSVDTLYQRGVTSVRAAREKT